MDTSKNNGQIGNLTGKINGTTQWLQGFQYDELGRLSNVAEYQSANMSSQTYSQGYSYDRYGNRAQSANTTLGLPAVSSSDYSATTNRFGSGLATYDNAGNITTDSKFRSLTYAYDANSRQTSASNGTWTETQVYDCAGQRVQTTTSSVTRTMVYDVFGQNVADYSGSSLERENIYRGGQLVATYEAGTSSWKYVMQDEKSSTRAVMNNSGGSSSVIARHDYLPFGEEIASGIGLRTTTQGFAATDTNRQKYAMTERDDVTGLDHTWWRKYESFSGRWTSPDPLGGQLSDPQGFNRYAYVQNDPVNFVDPLGLDDYGLGPPPPVPTLVLPTVTINTWAPRWPQGGIGGFFGDEGMLIETGGEPGSTGGEGGGPQNPTPEQRAATRAAGLLGNNNCSNFIAELISIAALVAGQPWSGLITPTFGPLLSANGNFAPSYGADYGLREYGNAVNGGRVTASGASGRSGDTTTYGTTTNYRSISWNREFYGLGLDDQALMTLHESLHLIPNFSDFAVAGAAHIMATRGTNNPGNTGSFRDQTAASEYINQQIAAHCRP